MPAPARSLVLVDWNGTVMDDLDRALAAINAATAEHGLPALDRPGFQRSFTLPMRTWLRNLGVPEDHLEAVEAAWNVEMQTSAPLRAGVADTLRVLRTAGVVTGVVTAANRAAMRYDVEHTGLRGVFDHVHTSVRDKAARLAALRPLGRRAYYVGDTAYDIECARTAGYVAIGVGAGYQAAAILAKAGADHHLEHFSELLDIVGPVRVA
ncbi:HAD family hydrolase [Georgenia thermotolerans]|uniref:HAD hydrolase-like protein n=1 Tax=Georgenia thermotolerans TaxID=527326 RepID=A0A7J5UUP7_9MICO|nr:HAD hydrolase-like protein [Georgenia thermotolerans]KAE8765990.1 HAD hydrolase-like protein [Georgenia thermotolerans]